VDYLADTGGRIKELRENLGLTQTKLAQLCDVSKATIINWEQEKRIPNITKIRLLAKALHSNIYYLSGEHNAQPAQLGLLGNAKRSLATLKQLFSDSDEDINDSIDELNARLEEMETNGIEDIEQIKEGLKITDTKFSTSEMAKTKKDSLKKDTSLDIVPIAVILDSIKTKAEFTSHEDRVLIAQMLRRAIQELEAVEDRQLDGQISDGAVG
jgi:transcriptional regulator with XRE-family HTH domain